MQSAINELSESLATKDDIIATKDSTVREHFKRIREMANMAHLKEDEHLWEKNKLQVEINHLMKLKENEIAWKEWHEKRPQEEKDEYRQFRYTELQVFKYRENSLEAVKDEFMDENVALIESNLISFDHELLSSLGLASTLSVTRSMPR